MRIGIDARFYGVAGPGRYVKNLIKYLEQLDRNNDYFVFLRRENYKSFQPKSKNFKKVLADYPWYTFTEQIFMPFKIFRTKVDLMHFPHFNTPLFYFGPFVLTIHDLIMHEFSTERATTRSRPYYKFKRVMYKILVRWAVKRAKKILVPSKATRVDLVKIFGVSEEKIVVTYEGIDDKFYPVPEQVRYRAGVKSDILEKYKIREPYLFYLGSMYPHKNVERLLEAFKILKETFDFKGQLVLIGKKDYFSQRIEAESEQLGLRKSLVFPGHIHGDGYVPDEELIEIFEQAHVFVFPSLKEGFGLPLLEAMALKVPVVVSNVSSLPEICQNAAYYFNPMDTEDIAIKINDLLKDNHLREELISRGTEQVKKFNWEKMAKETLEVYKRLEL